LRFDKDAKLKFAINAARETYRQLMLTHSVLVKAEEDLKILKGKHNLSMGEAIEVGKDFNLSEETVVQMIFE
jgi:hypothetical protein